MHRILGVAMSAILLAACASQPTTPAPAAAPLAILDEVAVGVAGQYVSVRTLNEGAEPAQLLVSAERDGPDVVLQLSQTRARASARDFLLTLQPSQADGQLSGRFVPLHPDGSALAGPCEMRFRVQDAGLVGETDPRQCRFGSGESMIGLRKEIAFDGVQVLIADQLYDSSNAALGKADVLEFRRTSGFRGSAAVRDGGSDWRLGADIQATPGLELVEPLDASGMSLGILLNLEFLRQRAGDPVLLRLQVTGLDDNWVLGEAWTEASAESIGLGLDNIRIDLRRASRIQ